MRWRFWKSKKSPVKPESQTVGRSPVPSPRRQPASRDGRCHDEPLGRNGPGSLSRPPAGRATGEGPDGRPTCCGGGGR